MEYQQLNIIDCGNETLTVRRNKIKYEIKYFGELPQKATLAGYTSLARKKKKDALGELLYDGEYISAFYEKKPKAKRIIGYVRADNVYIAVTSSAFLLMLLPLLLMLLLACVLGFCSSQQADETTEPFVPTIDDNTDEETTSQQEAASQIKIAGFTSWSIPAGQTENLAINLKNPEDNPCYFTFSIILSTGETIYKSDMVPPGSAIKKVSITEPLTAGTYEATVHIDTNELETGREMNSANLNIEITVA